MPSRARAPDPTATTDAAHVAALYERIYRVARKIPRGTVATYGQVAELAGIPRGHRVAGAAMKAVKPSHRVPWQRVVGKRSRGVAQVNIKDPVGGAIQRKLLEKEGVEFTKTGGIRLADHGWLPPGA
jgi:methylated-DNA-protein-cysteine methyltransferase-like protein